jgi:hypothetical protein
MMIAKSERVQPMARDGGRDIRKLSKTRIDRLGDRLRKGNVSEADLQLLDGYRRTFAVAYDQVIRVIRSDVGLEPTGRPAKTTTSISEKLRRESIRLTQIQDIAGCRIVVSDVAEQDRVVERLRQVFDKVDVVDRRTNPSHGYRAVHVVVCQDGKLIEIQVRTGRQHLWAQFSESCADLLDPMIKYGGGDEATRSLLSKACASIQHVESTERELVGMLATTPLNAELRDTLKARLGELHEVDAAVKRELDVALAYAFVKRISTNLETKRALSD